MIDPDATNRPLSYWESELGDWAVANGTYKVYPHLGRRYRRNRCLHHPASGHEGG